MATVFYCSPTNDVLFTTCCEVAILGHQANCPVCRQDVQPRDDASRHHSATRAAKNRGFGNYWPNHGEGRPTTPESADR